ncbi:MAG: DUF3473 domain-containing protein, partial [Gemmataceae bacterium]|nr:DUF3473 domain-containing protein [Gemmataceae bacterium]
LLDLLDAHSVKATFFILGWVAKRHPELVREIATRGHEIASHGMSHVLVYTQSKQEFRNETQCSKALLEDLCQQQVIGYRAATYSITRASLWALDIIYEAGFKYDSSIVPIRHDNYGITEAYPFPSQLRTPAGFDIIEFPVSVFAYKKLKVPVAGGGYFRLFPYGLTKSALQNINNAGHDASGSAWLAISSPRSHGYTRTAHAQVYARRAPAPGSPGGLTSVTTLVRMSGGGKLSRPGLPTYRLSSAARDG